MITSLNYAQDKAVDPVKRILEQKNTISVGFQLSEPTLIGFTFERKQEETLLGLNYSEIYGLQYGGISVTNGLRDVIGNGFVGEVALRFYLKKGNWKGFYTQTGVEGGTIKFSDYRYSGNYQYFSIANPEIGFKWQVSKGFVINPSIGCMWKIEYKGTGDVDNNIYNNFVPKFGLKMGYSF